LAFIDRLLGKLRKERIWAVDLGCGNGRYMLRYQGATKGRLIGADFSISGLRGIREIDSSADLAVADVMGLPFRDGVLDVVLMVGVVYEIEDLDMHRAVFTEIRRVLKPGGVCLFVSNSNLHLLDRLYARFPKYNPIVRKLLGKAPVDRDDLRFWYYRLTDADVRNYARVAGLRLEGPQYCNVRSGLGRTWDGVLVTEDSYENLIRFKANPLVKVIGHLLLASASLLPNLSARTAVYQLYKGEG
jgi:SAM-dependent methyltransferase